ncbi:hypothetical protein M501DRAFT_1028235 [Patellaria atrata CBS 101060]|uniref:Azaphilone pigments biosynthesis cluster protein L N-terminal domain-containing protein n=1 Tax=Patellaria atrata CBS 101060 TaxID=1346257 RepID=A0A9P4VVD1_9PEZI|nr:hypothetical protein M501DRAFT_1028235 [Patellaria atrata CBS 101060]
MADPLSIASGIVALITAAYCSCNATYDLYDGIRSAPKDIRALSDELRSFYVVLGTLKSLVDDKDTIRGVLHPSGVEDLHTAIASCIGVICRLRCIATKYFVSESKMDLKGRWKGLQWTVTRKEVVRLREQLSGCKITLSIAIASANLINTTNAAVSTRRIEEDVRLLRTGLVALLTQLTAEPNGLGCNCTELSKKGLTSESNSNVGTVSCTTESTESTYKTAQSQLPRNPMDKPRPAESIWSDSSTLMPSSSSIDTSDSATIMMIGDQSPKCLEDISDSLVQNLPIPTQPAISSCIISADNSKQKRRLVRGYSRFVKKVSWDSGRNTQP